MFTQIEYGKKLSCPFCGDGKSKKPRATIVKGYQQGDVFTCRNCSISVPIQVYYKEIGIEYIYNVEDIESLIKKRGINKSPIPSKFNFNRSKQLTNNIDYDPVKFNDNQISILKRYIKPLDYESEQYLLSREIPKDKWRHFLLTYDFMNMYYEVNKIDKISKYKEKRLLIEFKDLDGNVFALKGRSFEPKPFARYLTLYNKVDINNEEMDNTRQPLFNLHHIDLSKNVYVFEGEIDSMFMGNSFALGSVHKWNIVDKFNIPKSKIIYVLDNDYDGKKTSVKALMSGYKVFSWRLLSRKINYPLDEIIDINNFMTTFNVSISQLNQLINDCIIDNKLFIHLI